MNPKKSARGVAVAATLAVSLGAGGGLCYAATSYEPTVQGNDAYDNLVDDRNGYPVEGINYTASIANQNADTVAEARALAVTIGSDVEGASPIIVTNSLGKTVKEFSFRTSGDSSYPGNQMSGTLSDGESACWNFEYGYAERDVANGSGVALSMPLNYLLQVVFEDGTTAEFHNVNMNGVRTLNLRHSDDYGVYYVERTTITNHTPDPNLYYEVNLGSYEGGADEFDYHVNSGGRMGELMYTESRGNPWNVGHDPLQAIEDYGVDLPLHGASEGEGITGSYVELFWNSDELAWR